MVSSNFIAHHREFDHAEQTVYEHLHEVSFICKQLTEKIGLADAGELLRLLHDFGKYSKQFQSYVQSAAGKMNPDIDNEYVDAKYTTG